MRIISGTYKGRTLKAPEGKDTRPTTDRVRESVMSSLVSWCEGLTGANVLDLFAGSGALGIECLSRGAAHAVFCDSSAKAARIVEENLRALDIGRDTARVIKTDAMRFGIPAIDAPFDVVLLDPPYRFDPESIFGLLEDALAAGRICEEATIVYEYGSASIDEVSRILDEGGAIVLNHRKFGSTCVDLFRMRGNPAS